MSKVRVQAIIRDEAGNKLGGTGYEVRYYLAGTNTLATLNPDATSGSTLNNPHYPNSGVQGTLSVDTAVGDTVLAMTSVVGYQQGDFITLDDGSVRTERVIISIAANNLTLNTTVGRIYSKSNTRVNGRENRGHVAGYVDNANNVEMTVKNLATGIEGPREFFWIQPGTAGASGALGYAQVTANQGSITTETDLTSLTLTVTVGSGRRIRVKGYCQVHSSVSDDIAEVKIKESTTVLQIWDTLCRGAGNGMMSAPEVILTPSAGSHTYKLSLTRISGTGSLTMDASATNPASILVEDIGT